jgi:hypothetical protein
VARAPASDRHGAQRGSESDQRLEDAHRLGAPAFVVRAECDSDRGGRSDGEVEAGQGDDQCACRRHFAQVCETAQDAAHRRLARGSDQGEARAEPDRDERDDEGEGERVERRAAAESCVRDEESAERRTAHRAQARGRLHHGAVRRQVFGAHQLTTDGRRGRLIEGVADAEGDRGEHEHQYGRRGGQDPYSREDEDDDPQRVEHDHHVARVRTVGEHTTEQQDGGARDGARSDDQTCDRRRSDLHSRPDEGDAPDGVAGV